jgi:hypothetical protein
MQWRASIEGRDPDPALAATLAPVRMKAVELFAPRRWSSLGLDFHKRRELKWTASNSSSSSSSLGLDADEEARHAHQAATDAAALAHTMQISPLQAKQLLMHNTAVMQREAKVMYT